MKNPNTWKNLKRAASIKNFTIGNLDLMNNDDAIVPNVKYHRKCYETFTMKSKLEKIEKSEQVIADPQCHMRNFQLSGQKVILIPKSDFYLRRAFLPKEQI